MLPASALGLYSFIKQSLISNYSKITKTIKPNQMWSKDGSGERKIVQGMFLELLNVLGVGVSCRKLYSFVVYLYINDSGSITSIGEERANLSAVVYL